MNVSTETGQEESPIVASIIISSYNYANFLPACIESAINQTYPWMEIIVVDDGSVDDSRSVIRAYGERIIPLYKENGGQASALNAGFRVSTGHVVFFVDSDDVLSPHAVERVVACFNEHSIVKTHWPLSEIDRDGVETGRLNPDSPLAEGDLRDMVIADGFAGGSWPPTSGNAWARSFLARVLPIPEKDFVTCPDAYLCTLAPLFGIVRTISTPLAAWRIHGDNHSLSESFGAWIEEAVTIEEHSLRALERFCERMGREPTPERWRRQSWRRRLQNAAKDMAAVLPAACTYIFVDQDTLAFGDLVPARHKVPFLERYGQYWGPPADDESAIRELTRLRSTGAAFIVFAWPVFWWFNYYADFGRYLRFHFPCVVDNDRVIVFDLRYGAGGRRSQ